MSTPKAIAGARVRVKAIEQEIAAREAAVAAAHLAARPAALKLERLQKRHSTPPVVLPSGGSLRWYPEGIRTWRVGYLPRDEQPRTVKRLTELVAGGTVSVDVGTGVSSKAKGIAQRARIPTPESIRAYRKADAAVKRATLALQEAEAARARVVRGVLETGARIEVEQVAAYVAARHLLIEQSETRGDYRIDWLRRTDLPDAKIHLAHAESRSKDECPCARCRSERVEAEWRAKRAAADKQRAKEQAAEERRIARLPKRTFTCPNCDDEHESPVFTDPATRRKYVECDGCEQSLALDTIKSSPIAPAKGQQALPEVA